MSLVEKTTAHEMLASWSDFLQEAVRIARRICKCIDELPVHTYMNLAADKSSLKTKQGCLLENGINKQSRG